MNTTVHGVLDYKVFRKLWYNYSNKSSDFCLYIWLFFNDIWSYYLMKKPLKLYINIPFENINLIIL